LILQSLFSQALPAGLARADRGEAPVKLTVLQAPEGAAAAHASDPHGMLYDNPLFWDRGQCDAELERVFTICNGCRLCFNLCPSFDVLFKRVDALDPHAGEAEGKHLETGRDQGMIDEHEAAKLLDKVSVDTSNPVKLLGQDDIDRVVGLCYECKLCFPKCPYVPPHEFAVDFPKLILRRKMIDAKEHGIGLRERFLGATDLVGTAMTKIAPLANAAAHNGWNRMLMERTLGIAKDRQLPDYAEESFETWWSRRAPVAPPERTGDDGQPAVPAVALFPTCFGNYHDPEIPKSAVEVLERAGCDLVCPEVACCGMPKMDCGDLAGARVLARRNADALLPLVRAGRKVLSPGPSCTLMLKQEYPELLGPEGKELADAVVDLSDFLLQLGRQKLLPKPPAGVGKVAFHVACHNRVQNIGYRGRDLLKWAGGDVTLVDKCCGMDGTWGMKSEYFEESLKIAEGAARKVESTEPDVVAADCPLAGAQLKQKTGRRAYHPVKILRAAYRGEPLRSPAPGEKGDK
jgi:Fe-S oxidoreductase